MLVITRKDGEGIWLEIDGIEPIHITVFEIGTRRAKVGIDAEYESVRIYRDNIYEKVLKDRNNVPMKETTCPALPTTTPLLPSAASSKSV